MGDAAYSGQTENLREHVPQAQDFTRKKGLPSSGPQRPGQTTQSDQAQDPGQSRACVPCHEAAVGLYQGPLPRLGQECSPCLCVPCIRKLLSPLLVLKSARARNTPWAAPNRVSVDNRLKLLSIGWLQHLMFSNLVISAGCISTHWQAVRIPSPFLNLRRLILRAPDVPVPLFNGKRFINAVIA